MRRRSFLRYGSLPALGALAPLPLADRTGATATAEFGPIARFGVPKAKEAAVTADGRTVFLAVTDGFAAVDISDPAAPELLHENRAPWAGSGNGRLRKVFDVKLDRENDYLAVVGPAEPNRSFHGLIVYDVSDPANPERVAVHETAFFNHNCDAAGGHVYLAGGSETRNALVVVDAATGDQVGEWSVADANPEWEGVPDLNWVLHDVHVRGDLAYLAQWDAGTWIVDVSDPTAPEPVASVGGRPPERFQSMTGGEARNEALQPPGNDHVTGTNEDGTLLAVGVESWDVDRADDVGGPGGITLYDVSDPANPVERAVIAPPPTPNPTFNGVWTTSHNLDIQGETLYSSWYAGGVRAYDVSDPTEPVLLAAWRADEATSFWTAQGATADAFVAVSRKGPTDDGRIDQAGAALFTFPVPEEPIGTPSPTPGATPTPAATATPTPTAPATDTDTPTATDDPDTDTGSEPVGTATTGDGPGFGPLAALVGLGAGAWHALRTDGD